MSNQDKEFYQYMLSSLEHSVENSKRIEGRADRAIDLFLAIFTALVGGSIAVMLTAQDQTLKTTAICFILLTATGIGTLTYIWVLAAIIQAADERVVRYFLHQYFKDLNPDPFKKYGRAIVLDNYNPAIIGKGNFTFARSAVLVALICFVCVVFIGSVYAGWIAFTGFESFVAAILAGIFLLILLTAMWMLAERQLKKISKKAQDTLATLDDSN